MSIKLSLAIILLLLNAIVVIRVKRRRKEAPSEVPVEESSEVPFEVHKWPALNAWLVQSEYLGF